MKKKKLFVQGEGRTRSLNLRNFLKLFPSLEFTTRNLRIPKKRHPGGLKDRVNILLRYSNLKNKKIAREILKAIKIMIIRAV